MARLMKKRHAALKGILPYDPHSRRKGGDVPPDCSANS
ncbi:hypothetical protein BSSC8_05370 [Bacillus subtilis subsp. subtilis str. SC-8]|nr:hypothetical protein BSSC8_05370 [Bacillus subtilis subsp. subtilis str. SC-8]